MPINSKETKTLPIPDYKVKSNTVIYDSVTGNPIPEPLAAAKEMPKISINPYTIQEEVSKASRTTPPKVQSLGINPGIDETLTPAVVYQEPKIPDVFPSKVDYIKSLDFSASNLSPAAKRDLSDYYNLVLQLMNGKIEVNEYYTKMPTLIEGIKGVVLTETDWENLRDAILRTQNYILHYLWSDMQDISKKMDDGFNRYQKSINDWILKANEYYTSDDFIPQDTIRLKHLSKVLDDKAGRHEIAQNVWDSINGMNTRISSAVGEKPPALQYKQSGAVNEKDFPQNKGLVWIELV